MLTYGSHDGESQAQRSVYPLFKALSHICSAGLLFLAVNHEGLPRLIPNPPSPRSCLGCVADVHFAKTWGGKNGVYINIYILVMLKTYLGLSLGTKQFTYLFCSGSRNNPSFNADAASPTMHCDIRGVHEPTAKFLRFHTGFIIPGGMCISLFQGHLVCDSGMEGHVGRGCSH